MTIDDFMKLPGLGGERGETEDQIRAWLGDIQSIDEHHLGCLEEIVSACRKLWEHPHHPHFTTHGLAHSGRIVARLADWLAANRPDALQPMEAFLLIGAAYLHDVGMQCVCPALLQGENISSSPEQIARPDYALLENIRRKHALLSARMIRDACKASNHREYPEFALDAASFAQEAELMAVISRHHGGPVSGLPRVSLCDGGDEFGSWVTGFLALCSLTLLPFSLSDERSEPAENVAAVGRTPPTKRVQAAALSRAAATQAGYFFFAGFAAARRASAYSSARPTLPDAQPEPTPRSGPLD